jgi:hypothetical protein
MKKPKYHNKVSVLSGKRFDSLKESKRFSELSLLQKLGKISNLETQKPFLLIPKQDGERAVKYIADFVYTENGNIIVEDVKSAITRKLPAYIIKRKLMLYFHGIKIKEV